MKFKTLVLVFLIGAKTTLAQVKTITLPALKLKITEQTTDKIIINFWATWCKPCVTELPQFEQINTQFDQYQIKVILVSVDFLNEIGKVNQMVKAKGIKSEVWLMNAKNQNEFIEGVSKNWSGSVPASWLINKKTGKNKMIEKSLTKTEILKEFENLN